MFVLPSFRSCPSRKHAFRTFFSVARLWKDNVTHTYLSSAAVVVRWALAVPGVEYEIVRFRATSLAYLLFNRRRSQAHGVSVMFARSKSETGKIDRKKRFVCIIYFIFFSICFYLRYYPIAGRHALNEMKRTSSLTCFIDICAHSRLSSRSPRWDSTVC